MNVYGKIKVQFLANSYHFFNLINRIRFALNGVKWSKGLKIRGTIDIRKPDNGYIKIGENVLINSARWANPIGLGDKTRFELFNNGSIEIGNNVGISNTKIATSCLVHVGNNVLLGAGTQIYGTDFHPVDPAARVSKNPQNSTGAADIVIEDNVFTGANVIILKGVTIGKNSTIGAGSVVTKDIPENEVWAGNPAKCVRKLVD